MRAWEHAAIAAIPLVLYTVSRYRRLPRGETILVVLLASQFPDIVDKPLAHTFNLIPNGRSFLHSIVVGGLFLLLLYGVASRYERPDLGRVFAWGHLSHIGADFHGILSQPDLTIPGSLFWPITTAPTRTPPIAYEEPFLSFRITAGTFPLLVVVTALICYGVLDVLRRARSRSKKRA